MPTSLAPTRPSAAPHDGLGLGELSGSLEITAVQDPDLEDQRLPAGTRVGRYTVVDWVGAGAMGEVYAASDPQLGRMVALKRLRRRAPRQDEPEDIGRARLLREAQALARLSHPHVVPVYDVGVVDEHLFLAMELILGRTLRRWAKARPRPWREIVRVMLGAGRGLAAAHEAGLVHRDFKPDNVLVDPQQCARVMDFGLARGLHEGGEASNKAAPNDDLGTTLTRTGSVMGTPSYMSPEQHLGRRVDARSDQYAYCVAFYELLHGVRPFSGSTVAELARQKWLSEFQPGNDPEVPRWLRKVIERGLHPEADRRWPSMSALLDEIQRRTRAPKRRGWLAGAGVCLILGGLSLGITTPEPSVDPGLEHAPATALSLMAPPASARQRSFRQGLAQAEVHEQAGDYRRGLELATEALSAAQTLDDPILEAEARLRLGHLHQRLRNLPEAETELTQALWLAEANDADIVAAKAAIHLVWLVGDLLDRPSEGMAWARHARSLVTRSGDDPLLLAHLLQNEASVSVDLADHATALQKLERAITLREANQRANHPDLAMAYNNYGTALAAAGRHEDALAQQRRALAIQRLSLGPEHPHVAISLTNIGTQLLRQGRYVEANTELERAREIFEGSVGTEHPLFAHTLSTLAGCRYRQHDFEGAVELFARVVEIREHSLHPDHPEVATALSNLGGALNHLDHRSAEALVAIKRAVAIIEEHHGPEHLDIAAPLINLAEIERVSGDLDAAHEHLLQGIAVLREKLGSEHPSLLQALRNLGSLELERERPEAAFDAMRRARALSPHSKRDPQLQASLDFLLARAMWETHRDPVRARQLAEDAEAVLSASSKPPPILDELRTWLAEHEPPL